MGLLDVSGEGVGPKALLIDGCQCQDIRQDGTNIL